MGFRFRKSINLGKNFRINPSKSGIGYSVGSKGFRYTRSATGRKTVTTSIPGTGLSYTTNLKKKNKHRNSRKNTVRHQTTSSATHGCLLDGLKWFFILAFWPISLIILIVKQITRQKDRTAPPVPNKTLPDRELTPADVMWSTSTDPKNGLQTEKENFWDSPVLKRHYELLDLEGQLYSKVHQTGDYRSNDAYHFEAVCKEDITLAEEFIRLHKEYGHAIPRYPCFKQLAIFYEKQGNYHLAITVCEEAIRLGFEDDGTQNGMTGRIEKLMKKQLHL